MDTLLALGILWGLEMLVIRLRGASVGWRDGSGLITALLLVLALPPLAPAYVLITALLIALLLGKQVYGGLGYNLFNPAMVGYAAVLIAFPWEMTRWHAPDAALLFDTEHWSILSNAKVYASANWDALSTATLLDANKYQLTTAASSSIATTALTVAYSIGGGWLLWLRLIDWRIPAAFLLMLSSIIVISGIHHASTFHVQLWHSSTILAAFFVLTDPVTMPAEKWGRVGFAMMVAFWVYLIRTFGGYPDGIAFAILLGNAATPLIDQCSQKIRFLCRRV